MKNDKEPNIVELSRQDYESLTNSIRNLDNFPSSYRLAQELIGVTMPLIQTSGLYLPFVPIEITIDCVTESFEHEFALLQFQRDWRNLIGGAITGQIISLDEKIGVQVVRDKSSKFPTHVVKANYDSQRELDSLTHYNLNSRHNPIVAKVVK